MARSKSIFRATQHNQRNEHRDFLVQSLFFLMTMLLILPVLIILATLIWKGGPAISWEFLFSKPTNGMTAGGIFPALVGTVWLVTVALLVSVPLGIAAALYLSEYAPDNWLTRVINLRSSTWPACRRSCMRCSELAPSSSSSGLEQAFLAASLTLAIMTLPVVIVATRESLQAVPHAFREACWNMGATRWQTIRGSFCPTRSAAFSPV